MAHYYGMYFFHWYKIKFLQNTMSFTNSRRKIVLINFKYIQYILYQKSND